MIFISKKMQCCPTLKGGKNCLSSAPTFFLGNFSYLETKISFQLMHITESPTIYMSSIYKYLVSWNNTEGTGKYKKSCQDDLLNSCYKCYLDEEQ